MSEDEQRRLNIVKAALVHHSEQQVEKQADWIENETLDLWRAEAPDNDDDINLLGNCFLYRGGGGVVVGPTGSGKSSFMLQCCILWANGYPAFGIQPQGRLRVLMYQGEGTARSVIRRCRNIKESISEQHMFGENAIIRLVHRSDIMRYDFMDHLSETLRNFPFDLVIIDPFFSYAGIDAVSQDAMSIFLRNKLTPLLADTGAGALIVHHTPKPQQGDRDQRPIDVVYSGFGSSELPNWARCCLVLDQTKANGYFRLHAAKNGGALGWSDDEGLPVYTRSLKHNPQLGQPDSVLWSECDDDEAGKGASMVEYQKTLSFGDGYYRGSAAIAIQMAMDAGDSGVTLSSIANQCGVVKDADVTRITATVQDLARTGQGKANFTKQWLRYDTNQQRLYYTHPF